MSGQVALGRRIDWSSVDHAPPPSPDRDGPAPALAPLVIDLDAHLPAGLGWEIALCAARARPAAMPRLAARALRGRPAFEQAACDLAGPALAALPLDPLLRAALDQAEAEGRPVILMTAEHRALAEGLRAAHSDISDVIVTPGADVLGELARIAAIRARCPSGFVVLPGAEAQVQAQWARSAPVCPLPSPAADNLGNRAAPSRVRLWARALRLELCGILGDGGGQAAR